MARYKVGDKVVIVSDRTVEFNSDGLMDQWLGGVVTIEKVSDSEYYDGFTYRMEETDHWNWNDHMIDHKATKELKNVYKLLASDLKEGQEYLEKRHPEDILFSMRNGNLHYKIGQSDWIQFKKITLREIFEMRFRECDKFPRLNDVYYCISSQSGYSVIQAQWKGDRIDLLREGDNNVFTTKAEARFKLASIKEILAQPYMTGGKISKKLIVELFDNIQKI